MRSARMGTVWGWTVWGWTVWLVACSGADVKGSCDCQPDEEYCAQYGSDVVGAPTVLACEILPEGCDPADCDCLAEAEVPCIGLGSCSVSAEGLVKLTCPGG